MQLTPREIVDALDKYIIGQDRAKRAVAVALRNRYRRSCLSDELREEITPKNIIMIGPTGVGKTEIARRLAKLVDAPFVKVEATKYTEVGYVGRDVESMVRDLVEAAIRICMNRRMEDVRLVAEAAAEQTLADLLVPGAKKREQRQQNPLQMLLGASQAQQSEPEPSAEEKKRRYTEHERVLAELRAGRLEKELVEIEVEEQGGKNDAMFAAGIDLNIGEMFGDLLPKKTKRRKLPVKEARRVIVQQESEKRIDMDDVHREALQRAEQDGIIFIDEIDKIAGAERMGGPDVSREGVQRDILPIVEGSVVSTKYGPVKTDYVLFIAAGAFHTAKVSDLIPELQGRFPIRVKLDALTQEDFEKILTQPENAVTKQYTALLSSDKVKLSFTANALKEIAKFAYLANENAENIGARRLHTVMENLLDDISFNANGQHPEIELAIDAAYVDEHLGEEFQEDDLRKYIL
ncbi:MAG: ATP-dependent protease ATPase subunit HslU [Eubacteriales bacterium]|jgi:ATP-dependent HslUV protease ATP-binding subunit HslU|nr:ATP-dependent protease ATPase subunit HslU [Eubacteriales bacterium]